MTNIDRAEAILTARHKKDQLEGDGAVGCFDAAAAVAELHAAGLLTPDGTTTQTETAGDLNPAEMWAVILHIPDGRRICTVAYGAKEIATSDAETLSRTMLPGSVLGVTVAPVRITDAHQGDRP